MILSHASCYGCGVCACICKDNAITIQMSIDGFWEPRINKEKCTNCNLCEKVCSYMARDIFYPDDRIKPIGYSGFTKNEECLSFTTSGGIGNELGRLFLKKDYAGLGVFAIYKYRGKQNGI